jgi:ABC-type transporter Mla subunit MlaD
MSLLSEFSLWTWVLIGIIVLLTVYFHVFRYTVRTAEAGPAILTSIGIFGTFLGVALGLANFDTAHLQDSVPQLLQGLKTAFWSSIAGLLGALTIKFRTVLDITRQEGSASRQVTSSIDDLHDRLTGIEKSVKDEQGELLANSLALLRIEQKRQNEDLIHTMSHYQERMVQANTEALVGAIQHVMMEFNTRINEQYGDNFKRLNESVGRMLDWQVQYKDQLNELASNQQKIGKSMMDASAAFENMVSHAQAFNGISDSLGDMLKGLNVQREVLDQHLGGLAQLVNDAADGLPKLEDRITF